MSQLHLPADEPYRTVVIEVFLSLPRRIATEVDRDVIVVFKSNFHYPTLGILEAGDQEAPHG